MYILCNFLQKKPWFILGVRSAIGGFVIVRCCANTWNQCTFVLKHTFVRRAGRVLPVQLLYRPISRFTAMRARTSARFASIVVAQLRRYTHIWRDTKTDCMSAKYAPSPLRAFAPYEITHGAYTVRRRTTNAGSARRNSWTSTCWPSTRVHTLVHDPISVNYVIVLSCGLMDYVNILLRMANVLVIVVNSAVKSLFIEEV